MLQAHGIGPALREETYTCKQIRLLKKQDSKNKTKQADDGNDCLERNPLWMAGQEVPPWGTRLDRYSVRSPFIAD